MRKITTVDEAKEADKIFDAPKKEAPVKEKKLVRERSYTTEELNAFFTNIDDIKF